MQTSQAIFLQNGKILNSLLYPSKTKSLFKSGSPQPVNTFKTSWDCKAEIALTTGETEQTTSYLNSAGFWITQDKHPVFSGTIVVTWPQKPWIAPWTKIFLCLWAISFKVYFDS